MQNKTVRKLFVCEFITCGGLNGEHLPLGLAQEGRLMRDALFRDLQSLESWQVSTTHDVRVGRSQYTSDSVEVNANTDVLALWQDCMQAADYVWIIAPESSNILYQLTEMASACNKVIIGSDLAAIAIVSNKYKTAQVLQHANISTIPTFNFDEWQPQGDESQWVAKPVDGAGCEETFLFGNEQLLRLWFEAHRDKQVTHIIQPYLKGIPASVSVLGYSGGIQILSCNLQHISQHDGKLVYEGGEINGASAYWQSLEHLLNRLKEVLPGLQGYFGVDVLLDEQDLDKITLVEINPRLTTSYVELRHAISCNPAEIILNALTANNFIMPTITKKKIRFDLTH
jgi:predicted ATP-grasp superfamily ATP-dependent carboligase